jgi:hypothetical protein
MDIAAFHRPAGRSQHCTPAKWLSAGVLVVLANDSVLPMLK